MKKWIIYLLFYSSCASSQDVVISDIFESNDGKYWLNLKSDNTFDSQVKSDGKATKIEGVYEQDFPICHSSDNELGDIMLYSGEVQCCMNMSRVGDSWVMSKVWAKGSGPGILFCRNHLVKRTCRGSFAHDECIKELTDRGYIKDKK